MTTNTDTGVQGSGIAADKDASDFAVKATHGGMMEVDMGIMRRQTEIKKILKILVQCQNHDDIKQFFCIPKRIAPMMITQEKNG